MSEVFGVTPKGRDIPVRVRSSDEWAEHLRMFIPRPIKGYIWPVEELAMFLLGVENRDKILLHGEAGTGKSSLPEQVCAVLNIPFMRINCREDMESSAVFGSIHVENGSISWIPGPAEELARNGGMLQIDEISAAPPGVNMAMQWMLEDNGKVFLADKPGKPADKFVDPVESFNIVATDNTRLQGDVSGAYAGTQVQNSAMLDRFTNVIEMDYPDKRAEEQMITGRVPAIEKKLASKMVQVAGHIRAGFKSGSIQYPLSPRGCLEWAKKITQTGDIDLAFKHVYFKKLIEDDRKQVESYYQRVFADSKL
jgi:cobaltochelatase CobS